MGEASDSLDARSRKNLSAILAGLGNVGQVHVAKALGCHESTVSVAKSKEYPELAKALAAMNLKVVGVEARCYAPATIEPLLALAKQRMAQLENISQLEWDQE